MRVVECQSVFRYSIKAGGKNITAVHTGLILVVVINQEDNNVGRSVTIGFSALRRDSRQAAVQEEQSGPVVAAAGLSLNTTFDQIKKMSRVPSEEVYDLALSVDCDEAEALLICCTDFN